MPAGKKHSVAIPSAKFFNWLNLLLPQQCQSTGTLNLGAFRIHRPPLLAHGHRQRCILTSVKQKMLAVSAPNGETSIHELTYKPNWARVSERQNVQAARRCCVIFLPDPIHNLSAIGGEPGISA